MYLTKVNMYFTVSLLVVLFPHVSIAQIKHSDSSLTRIRLSSTKKENANGILAIPFKECGYVYCDADITTNDTVHYWDYYLSWDMPAKAEAENLKANSTVFVLGNRFQMPRSYLVFRGFNSDITGEYKCVLHFRKRPIASHTLDVTLADFVSTQNCII